jgi:hypothetical protein
VNRVLMTGSNGKIGSQLVPRLVDYERRAVWARGQNADRVVPSSVAGIGPAVVDADTLVLIGAAGPHAVEETVPAPISGAPKTVHVAIFRSAVTQIRPRFDFETPSRSLPCVVMRPPFFRHNLFLRTVPSLAGAGGLFFAMGDRTIGLLDLRDVVDSNRRRMPIEPTTNHLQAIADRLSDLLDRPIQQVSVPPEAVERSLCDMGMGDWFAYTMRDVCAAYAEHCGQGRAKIDQS